MQMSNSRLLVVKIGGNIVDDEKSLHDFLEKFSALKGKKILVHGGGKIATRLAGELGVESKLVEGRRITDEAMLRVVTMVYAGLSNKQIVAQLQALGTDAIGMTGADANSIKCIKRPVKEMDYGFVGDMMHDSVNTASLKKLIDAGFVPVFSAITHNGQGQLLNTNADTIASALAVGLSEQYETSLVYCFEKKGVLRDVENENSVIKEIASVDFERLKGEGVIMDGMIPKLKNAFDAIDKGVDEVYIGQADELHFLQTKSFGTRMIKQ